MNSIPKRNQQHTEIAETLRFHLTHRVRWILEISDSDSEHVSEHVSEPEYFSDDVSDDDILSEDETTKGFHLTHNVRWIAKTLRFHLTHGVRWMLVKSAYIMF
jgi:hypothetical protein